MENTNATKKSILIAKGVAQLIWALCILLTLVACLITGKWFFIAPSIIASAMNCWALYDVWTMWSKEKK